MAKVVSIQGQQRWEYCIETRFTELPFIAILNERGLQGWEVVNGMHHKDAKGSAVWAALLKRPIAGPAPPPDEQTATPATFAPPEEQPAAQPEQPQGFDLSDKEFELKKE
jgi:hypothetical protein